jgi:hypothetical protein
LRIALFWMSGKHASALAGLGKVDAANNRSSARLGRGGDARLLPMRLGGAPGKTSRRALMQRWNFNCAAIPVGADANPVFADESYAISVA